MSHRISLAVTTFTDDTSWFDVTAQVIILDSRCPVICYRECEEQVDRSTNTDILRVKPADPHGPDSLPGGNLSRSGSGTALCAVFAALIVIP